ncbi:GNAT family N-acetyltransferase [Rosistilla oblonga]|uniref:GNAT family N-acetyltransferase n=1 Tax=Rosistilla oblonga TaxID=2527990 RepID=UPI003A97701D
MNDPLPWPQPVTLHGPLATLEPLSREHHDPLAAAVSDGQLWKLWYTNVPTPDAMMAEIERRLNLQASGSMLPFVVRDANDTIVGMTTYMHIDAENRRLEIGSTWYAQRVQRTGLNTQCKLLLMSHAFETLRCIAVEYRTSSLNLASRRAIERLGAKLDGVLRSHQRHRDGTLRDTCVYSILQHEWPAVKSHLEFKLQSRG